MNYYIKISSWNLLETFATESISPWAFYLDRNFGNNLCRYVSDDNGHFNHLILSTIDFGGDYSICVDESLLDTNELKTIEDGKQLFSYPKTIFFKKGLVRFRFNSDDLKNSLIAESQIIFEIKCIEKYIADFFVDCKQSSEIEVRYNNMNPKKSMFISIDNKYNYLKGAVVGYSKGACTSMNGGQQDLILKLRNLKNNFAGAYTNIFLNCASIRNGWLDKEIEDVKLLYIQQGNPSIQSFDVLKQQYLEGVKYSELRVQEFGPDKQKDNERKIKELEKNKEVIEREINNIEIQNDIYKYKSELDSIKELERINGEKKGKTREYFKKGTPEYERKQYIKDIIEHFKDDNNEYKHLLKEKDDIEEKLSSLLNNKSKYDSLLNAIFTRVSDILNDLLKKVSSNSGDIVLNLSPVQYSNTQLTVLDDSIEMQFFNVVLNCILMNTEKVILSEAFVLQLIEDSCNKFKEYDISNSEDGQKILNTLRGYWLYKNGKTPMFAIPDNMPIFQSIMSFFIKPQDFEQIERYMLNHKYTEKCYALMLWGACVGYADLPKTICNKLYNNELVVNVIDDYFIELEKKLYNVNTQQ